MIFSLYMYITTCSYTIRFVFSGTFQMCPVQLSQLIDPVSRTNWATFHTIGKYLKVKCHKPLTLLFLQNKIPLITLFNLIVWSYYNYTFLRAHKGFLPSVQPLVRLQLTTLDKRLPTIWVVTQIRPLSLRKKRDIFQETVLPLFYNSVITQCCSWYIHSTLLTTLKP